MLPSYNSFFCAGSQETYITTMLGAETEESCKNSPLEVQKCDCGKQDPLPKKLKVSDFF